MHGQKTKNKNLVKKDRLLKKGSQKSESKNFKIKLPEDSTENWPIPSSQKDELQLIQGIGLATETALNKIGILKFTDFQNFTPATLSKTLEDKTGTSISVADIERNDWIGHTSRLAKEYTIDNSYEEIMETDSHQENNLPTKNSDKLKERSQTTQGVVRQPNASQKVSENSTEGLKKITGETTMSEKSERNKAQKSTKEAIELGASGQIAKQEKHSKELKNKTSNSDPQKVVKAEESEKPAASKAESQKDEKRESKLNIKKILFKQVSTNGVKGKKILKSEVTFALDVKKSDALLNERTPFCVQIHALEESTDHAQILASGTTSLTADKLDYNIQLDCKLPKIGNYQLKIVLFSLNPASMIDFREGPTLRIVS
ncbi:MAG: hypothetical protein E2O87_06760 [Bacteroidetes bacterium]|nr:MAG: hypothetical protein E2O87_06760 [Bacteroidota bacterium]